MKNSCKVLVVDDSKLIRKVICRAFEESENINVVGEAGNGLEALKMLPQLNPDVVTLDINMPVMDGLTALKHMMIKYPRPIVMLSSLTKEGAAVTFEALKYGAVDFVHKPSKAKGSDLEEQYRNMISKIILAADVETEAVRLIRPKNRVASTEKPVKPPMKFIFAIGTSEGGYGALLKIVPHLSPALPAAFISMIYAEPQYVDAYARYLDSNSLLRVKRVEDGGRIEAGVCYIASGAEQVIVDFVGGKPFLRVSFVAAQKKKQAINQLMRSLAGSIKKRAVGVILSGSGDDGVGGLSAIKAMGGIAIAQAPDTCLCRDMPAAAIAECDVNLVISDNELADKLNRSFLV